MALEGYPKGDKPGGATNERLAEAKKISTALVRQARLFALLYDSEEKLNSLLALRDPGGMPLTTLVVPGKSDRAAPPQPVARARRHGRHGPAGPVVVHVGLDMVAPVRRRIEELPA